MFLLLSLALNLMVVSGKFREDKTPNDPMFPSFAEVGSPTKRRFILIERNCENFWSDVFNLETRPMTFSCLKIIIHVLTEGLSLHKMGHLRRSRWKFKEHEMCWGHSGWRQLAPLYGADKPYCKIICILIFNYSVSSLFSLFKIHNEQSSPFSCDQLDEQICKCKI